MRRFGIVAVTVMGSTLALSAPAWSDEKGKKDKEEAKVSELVKDAKVTIDQAIKTASEKVQGTVVEAELEKKHGKTVWEVEIVGTDNKVTEVHIDAATGDVIDTEEKKEEKKGEKKKGKEKGK
ncbi:MAG: PepSY domain-containing protein [Nitrospirota bacterium]